MTEEELISIFDEEDGNDIFKFDDIKNKRNKKADLHAFLLLDELLPSDRDIVRSAEHDLIFLDVDLDELAKVISIEQICELKKCGVWVWEDYCLAMYV